MNIQTTRKLALVAAGWLLSCAFASPARAEKQAGDYWPMKVGNTWTIDVLYQGKTTQQVLTVVKNEPVKGNAAEASVEYKIDGKPAQLEVYRLDKKGIYREKSGANASGTIAPPIPVVLYPLTIGRKWKWSGTFTSGGATTSATAELSANGPESVITAAGNFKAVRVHLELLIAMAEGKKSLVVNDYWFSPGVGMVQQSFKQGDTQISGTMSSYQLAK